MIIECVDDGGFEDQLNTGGQYEVDEIGENSYLIENDTGQKRWYGTAKFKVAFVA